MSDRSALVLDTLRAAGRLDTHEIAERTGIARPGSTLHWLLVERKVKKVGERQSPLGRRPSVIWEAT